MDPLGSCFVDVSDLILQHFNARESIRCSLVSRSWNEIIGTTHNCMKHVWLRLDKPSRQIDVLARSERKYQNFRIASGARGELSKVFKMFRPKIAIITDNHDEEIDHQHYVSFLQAMAPTIEDLQPGEAKTVNVKQLLHINFPKLKELQYTVVNRNAFSVFLGSNPRLEKVLLSFSDAVSTDFLVPDNIIHTFFKRNPQIKSLWMCEIDSAFQTDITKDLRLDLQTFAFSKTNMNASERAGENLVKFIKLQTNLEWLKILCLYDKNIFLKIWNEAKFKKLFIMDCSLKGSLSDQELTCNPLIDEINFYLNPSCHIIKFLKASPNLKSFKIRRLSKQMIEFSAQNLRQLEAIQYQSIENDVEKFYNDLKSSDACDVNRRIELRDLDFYEFVGRDAGF